MLTFRNLQILRLIADTALIVVSLSTLRRHRIRIIRKRFSSLRDSPAHTRQIRNIMLTYRSWPMPTKVLGFLRDHHPLHPRSFKLLLNRHILIEGDYLIYLIRLVLKLLLLKLIEFTLQFLFL